MAASRYPRVDPATFSAGLDLWRFVKTNPDILDREFKEYGLDLIQSIYFEHGAVLTPKQEEHIRRLHEASHTGVYVYPGGRSKPYTLDDLDLYNREDNIEAEAWISVRYRGVNDGDCVFINSAHLGAVAVAARLPWSERLSYLKTNMDVDLVMSGDKLEGIILTFTPRDGVFRPLSTAEDAIIAKLRIDALPYELLVDVLSRLTPDQITGLCNSSVKYQGLCGTEEFWTDLIAAQGLTSESEAFPPMPSRDIFSILQSGVDAEGIRSVAKYLLTCLGFGRTPEYVGPKELLLKFTVTNIDEFEMRHNSERINKIKDRINNTTVHVDDANKVEDNIKMTYMNRLTDNIVEWIDAVDVKYFRTDLLFGWEDGRMRVHFVFTLLHPTDSKTIDVETVFSAIIPTMYS